jgi:flagellar protein FliS
MTKHDSASSYHQFNAFGATPVGQIIALYDRILRDLRRAMAAVDAGQIEERVDSTNHALVVIGELQGVLDFEAGGEPARHLNNFYNISRTIAIEASIASSHEKFQELIGMFARLRVAWSKVEKILAPTESGAGDRPGPGVKQQSVYGQGAPIAPEITERSGNGGWKA